MPLFRVYIAMSLDGYIATSDGGVEWLEAYPTDEFDMAGFFNEIAVTVMGRRTFDEAQTRGPWPYRGQRMVVLTHRPLDRPPEGVEAFGGDVTQLAERLRHELAEQENGPVATGRDVWLMGGADSIRRFHEARLIDRWELFIAPVLLGDGIRLFPPGVAELAHMRTTHTRRYDKTGFVELWYEPAR